MRNFAKGDQLFIYYGERPNSMFVLYQGFYFPRNSYRVLNSYYQMFVKIYFWKEYHYSKYYLRLNPEDKFVKAKEVFLMKHKLQS